ncbi:hypothetical protein B5807_03049 [Epicoccum nigrum]|uniref:Uncharacterized protein n=1 Tax=Epicoccum nigrum TaxID=105696 RepID=A0A1Y2M8P8_EPING|nr:hypothetical protein B5807_03049 [Epicoccum nigrum]
MSAITCCDIEVSSTLSGLELVKAYTAKSWHVTGTIRPQSRDDVSVKDLKETGVDILELDLLDERSIEKAARDFGDRPLDLLLNLGGKVSNSASEMQTNVRRTDTSSSSLARTDHLDVLGQLPHHGHCKPISALVVTRAEIVQGPFLTCKHFLPSLDKAVDPKIVNITSDFGSVSGKHITYSARDRGSSVD